MISLTEYLTILQSQFDRLNDEIDATKTRNDKTIADFQTPAAILDSMCRRRDLLRSEIRTVERAICAEKQSKMKIVRVNRERLTTKFGEDGVRVFESLYTQHVDFTKPYSGDIRFVVDDFDYIRLTASIRGIDYIAEPATA